MAIKEMLYIGDGMRAPDDGELVGKTVTINGRHGKVLANNAFTVTVDFEPWVKSASRGLFWWAWRLLFGSRGAG